MDKKLKVLMVSDDFLPATSGAGVYIQMVGRHLVDRGWDVAVLTTRHKTYPDGQESKVGAINIIRVPTLVLDGFAQAICFPWTIRRVLDRVRPDIVHIQYLSLMCLWVIRACHRRGIPLVFTYHFSPDLITRQIYMRPFRSWVYRTVKEVLGMMNCITVPTRHVFEELTSPAFGILPERIKVITNPVLCSTKSLQSLSKVSGQIDILYVGRLAVEKNVPYLLAALALALKQNEILHLWVAGDGPLRDALRAQVNRLNIVHAVTFLGHIGSDELANYYTACDFFVLPSIMEVLSLVTIEAMTFGRPIIVTDKISCAEELVENGINGFIVSADRVEDLVEKMLILANDPDRRQKMGAAALESAKKYDLNAVVTQIEEVYHEILQGGKR